jgi:hypothetical protein
MSEDGPANAPVAMQPAPPAGAGQRAPRACHGVGKPGKGMDCIAGEDV